MEVIIRLFILLFVCKALECAAYVSHGCFFENMDPVRCPKLWSEGAVAVGTARTARTVQVVVVKQEKQKAGGL